MQVLKARFRTANAFLEAYNDTLESGGIFCATTQPLTPDQPVIVEVKFPEIPNKVMLRGTVIDWRAALPRLGLRAGATIAFGDDDREKRDFLLSAASGEVVNAIKRRHTRLPVVIEVSWRLGDSRTRLAGTLQDISIGGAQLITDRAQNLAVDTDIVIEITAPGGAKPIPIAAKVSNETPTGYGVTFLYRDGGGSRRLREVVRRLMSSTK